MSILFNDDMSLKFKIFPILFKSLQFSEAKLIDFFIYINVKTKDF